MTARTSTAFRAAWDDDARQLVAVLVMAIVAVLLGLGLRTITEGATTSTTVGGVSASVPSGWIHRDGVGDTLFLVYDPRRPDTQYLVSRPGNAPEGATITSVADRAIAARATVLTAFSVLDRTTTTLDGAPAERIESTWARAPEGVPVEAMQGLDLVVVESGGPLIVTLESPVAEYDDAVPGFEAFAASVEG
jgi:hypothetical protein